MDFSFFITDNKSGYKTKEKWFKENHPTIYNDIISYVSNLDISISSFKEKIWFYFNSLTERPKCLTCSSEVEFRGRFDKPYGEFCTLECFNKNKLEMTQRQKKTFIEKYGVEFYPQHSDFIGKQKKTKEKKYGNENFNNSTKMRETKKLKYGNEKFNNIEKYKETCLSKFGSPNYFSSNEYSEIIEKNFKQKYNDLNIQSINGDVVTIMCGKCSQVYETTKQLLYERYKINNEPCTICNPIGHSSKSFYKKEISDFLSQNKITHITSDRKTITKELDVLIPEHKLAIEFNGLYWHNELFVGDEYHLNKTIECNNNGIKLLHIFEDEWLYKKEILKSIIKGKLNLIENKIYARECEIRLVTSKQSNEFLDKNHIQGSVNSKVRLGLYHNNILVSLMTFSKGRVILGGKKTDWELTRFCNLIDFVVIGAASKLFNFFIKNYEFDKIISYSDIRLFDGKLYSKLNFVRVSQSKPNYWYVKNGMRYYRFNFRKSKLVEQGFDSTKTEKEIMLERKIYRIYDCGNIRWEFTSL
jgi:hypothetical protein